MKIHISSLGRRRFFPLTDTCHLRYLFQLFVVMIRPKPFQLLSVLALFVLSYWYFFTGSEVSFTPEEINDLLQNKQQDIVSLKKVELTSLNLRKPYLDASAFKLSDWDSAGKTLVNKDHYIRLISDGQHQAGSIFSKAPLQAESFEMELTFHLHSKETQFHGDGFAVWFVDEKLPIGDVFGCSNYFNGLGIFIDTYKNGKRGHFPIVNLMLGDGKARYNKDTDGYETRLASCNANAQVINPRGGETKMRLVYIKNGYLSIDYNYSGLPEDWKNCVTLTDVHLPPVKYLGLSAESGQLTHAVDVLENKIFALHKPDGSYVESIEELQDLIKIPQETEEPSRKSKGSDKKRKSLIRLKKAEERIKQKERLMRLQQYGSEDATFVRRTVGKLWGVAKLFVALIIVVLAIWFVFIVVRVQRQKGRTRTTGLLD